MRTTTYRYVLSYCAKEIRNGCAGLKDRGYSLDTEMRLVLTHSAQHSAPKRQARYTPTHQPLPGLSFLCSEHSRTVKTLRFAPARSLISSVSACSLFLPHSFPQPPL